MVEWRQEFVEFVGSVEFIGFVGFVELKHSQESVA